MRIAPILARLAALTEFKTVKGAASLDAALANIPAARPCAFVTPLSEARSTDLYASCAIAQTVEWSFGVVLMADEASDARGSKGADALEGIRAAMLARLTPWVHPEANGHCRSMGGRLLMLRGPTAIWMQTFSLPGVWRHDGPIDDDRPQP